MTVVESIAGRLREVESRITEAGARAGRSPSEVTLVAVGKTWPVEVLLAGWEAGIRHLGENRVQEAEAKIAAWPVEKPVTWHLIGHLQSNKARTAASRFDWIHSIDSTRLVQALARGLSPDGSGTEPASMPPLGRLPILVEVNVAGEASKYGLTPDDVESVLVAIKDVPGLEVRGLMTVAPFVTDPEDVRPVFRALRELRDRLSERIPDRPLPDLSMGMSHDYEVAIAEGATIVRVGRAIFGERA